MYLQETDCESVNSTQVSLDGILRGSYEDKNGPSSSKKRLDQHGVFLVV
jgi:hypothetical protein